MTRVADLTVEELVSIIRSAVREAVQPQAAQNGVDVVLESNPHLLLDLPPSNIRLQLFMQDKLLSREEYYGDDGR